MWPITIDVTQIVSPFWGLTHVVQETIYNMGYRSSMGRGILGGHDCTKFATARGNMTAVAIWPLAKLLWALGVLLEFLVQYNMLKRCVNLYII